jgi:hypothetical protein
VYQLAEILTVGLNQHRLKHLDVQLGVATISRIACGTPDLIKKIYKKIQVSLQGGFQLQEILAEELKHFRKTQ